MAVDVNCEKVKMMMKDMITCSVCLREIDSPKSLPCLHMFCLKCLQTLPKSRQVLQSGTAIEELACPLCQKCCQIPAGGVIDLPTNVVVLKMIDTIDKLLGPTHFCIDCARHVQAEDIASCHPAHDCRLVQDATSVLDSRIDGEIALLEARLDCSVKDVDQRLAFAVDVRAVEAEIQQKGSEIKQLVDTRIATLVQELSSLQSAAEAANLSRIEQTAKLFPLLTFLSSAKEAKRLTGLREKALAIRDVQQHSQAVLQSCPPPPAFRSPKIKFIPTTHSVSGSGEILYGSLPFVGCLSTVQPSRKRKAENDAGPSTSQASGSGNAVSPMEEIAMEFEPENSQPVAGSSIPSTPALQQIHVKIEPVANPSTILPPPQEMTPVTTEEADSQPIAGPSIPQPPPLLEATVKFESEDSKPMAGPSAVPSFPEERIPLIKTETKDSQPIVGSSTSPSLQQLIPTVKSSAVAIGIDLGTSFSCVGVFRNGILEVIPNDLGELTTASCIAFLSNGVMVGNIAKNRRASNPLGTVFAIKRVLVDSGRVCEADRRHWPFVTVDEGNARIQVRYCDRQETHSAERLIAMLLRKLKKIAEAHLGQTVTDVTVSVPSVFSGIQRQTVRNAAVIAGFVTTHLINEASAAALAYGFHEQIVDGRNVLIFVLGGSTLNVAVVSYEEDVVYDVQSTSGDLHLGGEDFDSRLVTHLANAFRRKHRKDLTGDSRAMCLLRIASEEAKCTLSSSTIAPISIGKLFDGIDFDYSITRSYFDELNADLFRSVLEPVEKALRDAKVDRSAIRDIVLVGGSTRIPKIQKLLQDFFNGRRLTKSLHPDEGVARGAALLASIRQCGKPDNLLLLDVAPLSLGIESAGGVMSTLIPRNATIPATQTIIFTTYSDNQSEMVFEIYEGERAMTKDNIRLGRLELTGIPLAPRGIPQVAVTFDLDVHYDLTVTTVNQRDGRRTEMKVKPGLTDPENNRRHVAMGTDNTGAGINLKCVSVVPYRTTPPLVAGLKTPSQSAPDSNHPGK